MAAVMQLATGAAPANPGAGYIDIYADAGNAVHVLTSAGTDTTLATTAITLGTANITDANVTNAKLANVATATFKGRTTAGTGVPEDLTVAQAYALLKTTLDAVYATGATDAAWTEMTLGTYWTGAATIYPTAFEGYNPTWTVPGYRKVAGVVHLRGAVRCTNNAAAAVATLPATYRPAVDMWFVCPYSVSGTDLSIFSILIKTTGDILAVSNSGSCFHIDGICFPV